MNKKYSELAELFRSEKTDEEILDFLLNYHKNDIADMMAGMTEEERKRLYHLLGAQKVAEIFKYIEEPRKYIRELSVESAARVISEMDSVGRSGSGRERTDRPDAGRGCKKRCEDAAVL